MSNKDFIVTLTSGKRIGSNSVKQVNKKKSHEKFQIFNNFASHALSISDKYWYTFFNNASTGILPKSFKYDGKNLIFKLKNKTDLCDLSEKNYEKCKQFIVDNFEIISDKLQIIEEIQETEIEECTWSSFTPRIQIMYLTVFARLKGKEFKFSEEKINNLKQSLIFNCFLKNFGNSEVELKKGEISEIHSLLINKNGYKIK